MPTATKAFSLPSIAAGLTGVAMLAVLALYASQSSAAGTVVIRGVVKPGGSTDSVNVYITHVSSAPDPSAIRGLRTDVNVGKAAKYKWEVKKGVLQKVRTTSNPTPGQEVVIRGTLLDDDRITAAWMVQNYRQFSIEGNVADVKLDTGKTDAGWITINVTSSVLRDAVPTRLFKQSLLKGKDLRVRVDGTTNITALGKAKNFDEVSDNNQKVRITGQVLDEDTWYASNLNELAN